MAIKYCCIYNDMGLYTDFRSVYATALPDGMGLEDTKGVLKGDYRTLGVFS